MPTLKITITAELSEDAIAAFRERHAIEEHVLRLLAEITKDSRAVTFDMEVITGGLRRKGDKRPARPRLAVVPEPAA